MLAPLDIFSFMWKLELEYWVVTVLVNNKRIKSKRRKKHKDIHGSLNMAISMGKGVSEVAREKNVTRTWGLYLLQLAKTPVISKQLQEDNCRPKFTLMAT